MKKQLLKCFIVLTMTYALFSCAQEEKSCDVYLTLVPPTEVTNQVDLDIRAGIRNAGSKEKELEITLYLNEEKEENVLVQERLTILPDDVGCVKYVMKTED